MIKSKISFLGEGWGAIVAVKSLQKYFELEYLVSDENVIKELIGEFTLIKSIKDLSCEIVVCAGYKPIISKYLIEKHNVINIHYSLLPSYRGLHSTAWAIMNGEEYLGLTIHIMNQFIDDGPILHQKKIVNDQLSSASYYMEEMNNYIQYNLGDIVLQYIQGLLIPYEQDKKNASWVGKRGKKHNLIDFNESFEYCKRLFRVLKSPYPEPTILYNGTLYYVGEVHFHLSNIVTDISRVLNNDDEGVWVKSKEGYIILNEIKTLSGVKVDKNIFKIGSYLNG